MKGRGLKYFLWLLKLVITAAILWFVFRKFSLGEVLSTILHLPLFVFFVMLITTVFKHFTQYKNWKYSLLLNPRYDFRRSDVLSSYLIGNALRFVIPGGTATYGKMFYVQNSSKIASLLSVFSEKFFMTWTTWLFAGWAGLLYFGMVPLWFRVLFVAVCTSFPLLIYFGLGRFERTAALKPEYGRRAPRIIGFQILYVCTTFLQMWVLLRGFFPITFLQTVQRIALTNFANTIPITISGLGLRESFAIYFLEPAGFTAQQAVSATLTLFLFHDLVPALIGIIILLKTKKAL